MLSEEARIGKRVRVREDHRAPDRRGQEGTIDKRWGDPNYTALDVLLDDGDRQLFWHHELEEVPERVPKRVPGRGPAMLRETVGS